MPPSLASRFEGSLLGLAAGDALGARFEGRSARHIRERYPTAIRVVANPPVDELYYTDDTQMAIGVAEALVEKGFIDRETLCRRFAANYEPFRGYGRGARAILEALVEGKDAQKLAEKYYPGGSYGNGAAMRVGPVGLFFHHDLERVREEARHQSLPTHRHPHGIEGAQILAVAVALAVRDEPIDASALLGRDPSPEYAERIEAACAARSPAALERLGNGIAALDSVPTAIACHLLAPESTAQAIGTAILLGGDTDTIAAMAGAVSGAANGVEALPASVLDRLEDGRGAKGRSYLEGLARKLHAAGEKIRPR